MMACVKHPDNMRLKKFNENVNRAILGNISVGHIL